VNNPQSQALEAFRLRPVVSAVLIVLLALLIFAARGHQGEDQSLDAWRSSAVVTTDQLSPGG
jgi:hypothetical protein